MSQMHFGITVAQTAPWRDLADMCLFLDRETAFDSAWLIDHFVPGMPADDPSGICFEGWTTLAALAAITERIRLGVLVTGVTYRNPGLLAKMATTVDHVSGGRLELGIGAAWHDVEHRMYGYDFPPVSERSDRLEEAVQIIRLLFESDAPASFDGKHYQLVDATFDPKPVQHPRPPIVIGGEGEKRTLRTLARYGDVMDCGGTPAMIRRKIDILERHCRETGRDPSEIVKGYRGPIVVSDNQSTVDRIAELVAAQYGITGDEAKADMPIGNAAHVRDVVARYAEVGVRRMIMLSQAPWRHDIYGRISREVVEAVA
jgi:F420-dependent oxidoreductase-like protein